MLYLVIKALHVTAVIGWIGGMILQSIVLVAARAQRAGSSGGQGSGADQRFIVATRLWDSRTTSLSIFLVWVLGAYLIVAGGWLGAGWLWVKLAIAFVLSGIHGVQAGMLRRMAAGATVLPPAWLRYVAPGTLLGVFVVVLMVITKPF